MSNDGERDVDSIRLPRWGRVVEVDGPVPFAVLDADGQPIEPIRRYLRDFVAQGKRAGSVRSYAYVLLKWWRWLDVLEIDWDKATSTEVREFVLWQLRTTKPRRTPRTKSAATAGTINAITRKQYPGDRYAPRTIRHGNAVIRSFYRFWIERGDGPLINPVPQNRRGGRRSNAHHNPLEPFRREGRLRYNPPVPRLRPRAMPDPQWDALFAALRSDRDRALMALVISNASRASEILGVRSGDVDWGDQLVRVRRKGTSAEQWLPGSNDAFVWLRLYLDCIGPLAPGDSLWWTLRRRCGSDHKPVRQPLTYDALRAVLRRANEALDTNWTMHDLRHTCALRMLRDRNLTLRDIQEILGHAHLSTTQLYLEVEPEEVIRHVHQHLIALKQRAATPAPAPKPAHGYDAADLTVLFGGSR